MLVIAMKFSNQT